MFAFYFPLPVIQIQKAELFFETPTKHDHSVSDWTFSMTRSYLSQRPFNFQTGVIVREFHIMSISNLLPRDVLSLVWAQCSQIRHKKTVAIFHVATFRIFDRASALHLRHPSGGLTSRPLMWCIQVPHHSGHVAWAGQRILLMEIPFQRKEFYRHISIFSGHVTMRLTLNTVS